MPQIDLSILNQRQTPAFYADVFANRPAAGFVGRIFVSTDTFAFYRDNGTGWDLIGGPGTGTITGAGASGQIALWSGASTIVGDTGLTYNGTDNSLTASKFIVTGGTSSQFLKGDGSLDSNTYNTGSGAASQVAFFSGTNAISGENNLWWDSANNHLGINTNTPATALDVNHNGTLVAKFNNTTTTSTLLAFENAGNEQWWIGTENTNNDFLFYDATNFPTLSLRTTFKTSGQVLIGGGSTGTGKLVVESATSDNGIQIVGANAPSLRIDSAATGPTKRIGLGISTATNNFIQGSVDRDMCIFNGSTTASPILFGIYDAGAGNVQEAIRISSSRNLLVGTTVDDGNKLRVGGSAVISQNLQANQGNFLNAGVPAIYATRNLDVTIVGSAGQGIEFGAFSGATRISGAAIYGGLDNPATTGNLVFQTLNGGSLGTRVTITSSGNLLIGTTTDAGQKLQVNGQVLSTDLIQTNRTGGLVYRAYWGSGNNRSIDINIDQANGDSQLTWNTTYNGGWKYFLDNYSSRIATGDGIYFSVAPLGTAGNTISWNDAMSIKANGNVLIGTTTSGASKLRIVGLPTSAAGLSSGDVYSNLGILTIVP